MRNLHRPRITIRYFFKCPKGHITYYRHFSYSHSYYMDNPEIKRLSKELETLKRKHEELKLNYQDLKLDKEVANQHRLGLVKKENNQTVSEEEQNARSDIRETYTEFFEDDVEVSDPEMETSAEYKERKQVNQIIEYLNEEIKSSTNAMTDMVKQWHDIKANIDQILASTVSVAGPSASGSVSASESSPAITASTSDLTKPIRSTAESSELSSKKRKLSSEEDTPDKRINTEKDKSTIDFIDNLPSEYNPFDDLGGD